MSILKERQKTHGEYENVARVSQHLKTYLHNEAKKLSQVQRESLDMICVKLARIVCGDANELDHWIDISGYADLVVFNSKDANTPDGVVSEIEWGR